MAKQFKFFDFDIKKAAEPHAFWFTASTADRDRDGDVIVPETWKLQNYKKNPVVLYGHDYRGLPVGKSIDTVIENGKLRAKIEFASDIDEFAARVEKFVDAGYLRTTSVGFMPYKVEDLTEADKKGRPEMSWGKRIHAELLEISIVPVPANPAALAEREFVDLMAKGFGAQMPEEAISPLLVYKDQSGKVDERRLKACFAALLGARGGIKLADQERKAAYNHLSRVSREIGAEPFEIKAYTEKELREVFQDVWHGELLDIVTLGLEETDRQTLPLLKGSTRSALVGARDALTKLIDASEEAPIAPDANAKMIKELITNLSAVTGRLNK